MIRPVELHRRHRIGEVMDQPDLEIDRHVHALRGLARINRFSRASSVVWRPISHLACQGNTELSVLDLATGGGDLPIALKRRSLRAGLSLRIEGCDKSATAVTLAEENASRQKTDVRFFQLDVIEEDIPHDYDIVLCSLFLHHLPDDTAINLLARIAGRCHRMIIINDLRRCYAGYLLASLGTRVLSRSSVVHIDGPRSVRAAFTIDEISEMASRAGLVGVSVTRKWPFRYLLVWKRK